METPTLTKEECESFLTDILQIPDWNDQLQKDRAELLNHLMIKYQQNQPFQTLTLLRIDPKDRKVPMWQEIKTAILAKEGGLCHTSNTFMWALLKALGYDVYLSVSSVITQRDEQYLKKNLDHTIVIVRDLVVKGSLHVVDCALGLPIRQAVMIKDPTQDQASLNDIIYQGSGEIYKYVRTDDNLCIRYHILKKDKMEQKELTNDWKLSYWFNIQPNNFADFYDTSFMRIYLGEKGPTEEIHRFHYYILLTRLNREKRRITIRNQELLVENDEHIMDTTDIPSHEIRDYILKYFPAFKGKENIIEEAFTNMQKTRDKLSITSLDLKGKRL
ncbi:unnamed protein product [Owenia fusiformis]|uniref:arylamine N-acetyltransferase n=1 Tax=Owenia fusiformis TaxID=6347 RepID=A0A8J1TSB0_OWEFU|nr:unnamed protein product [Owenia fusiformis]